MPSPLQALLLRTVPRSPQSHRCDTLAQAPISLGHFKELTLRLDLLVQSHFAEKNGVNIRLVGQPCTLSWEGRYGEASQIPKSSMSTGMLTNPRLH